MKTHFTAAKEEMHQMNNSYRSIYAVVENLLNSDKWIHHV